MAIQTPLRPPVKKNRRRKSTFLRLLGFAFTAGVFVFLAAAAGSAYYLWQISKDLPDYDKLANYKPPVITRVHATDGRMIDEIWKERRVYVPVQSMPKLLINAFLAAEDRNFYEHNGLDFKGIARAIVNNLTKKRREGASTITQQVAKNFFLNPEQSMSRKAKEAILAVRIERAYTKDRILDLYLNQINLGANSYGVAAASLRYFGKELHELQIHEAAYLAVLPKAPSNYQLTTARNTFKETKDKSGKVVSRESYYDLARKRRDEIINNMARFGFIPEADADAAKKQPLEMTGRRTGPEIAPPDYFSAEVRRSMTELYGADENDPESIWAGGYSVRSTLDQAYQSQARSALRAGLVSFDRKHGWRGPVTKIEADATTWNAKLAEVPPLSDLDPWRLGVVLQVSREKAVIGLQPGRAGTVDADRTSVDLTPEGAKWAFASIAGKVKQKGSAGLADLLTPGDVIYVSPPTELDPQPREIKNSKGEVKTTAPVWQLMQIPKISGAIVVMDPHTGRVLAMVGGFSYAASQYNRAVQARRQPGSSFKPIVYAAALDNGYTPASILNDSVLAIEQGNGQDLWKPQNYDKQIYGPQTLRTGVEKSRNLMTVRLAQDLGMPIVSEYAKRFGVYEDLPPLLAMALGAGETSLVKLTTAYSMFVNGGKKIRYTVIDRVQDRYGATIWRHDNRKCEECNATSVRAQDEPQLLDDRQQVISPLTAFQMTSILQGVVIRGTGTKVASVGKPLAGKTGTTNDEKDAWFVGFSPDLAVGVFIGYDDPEPMGHGETGGELAAPIFRDFFKLALAGKPAAPFRQPSDILEVRVNKRTGQRTEAGDPDAIPEYFKPGTEPTDGNGEGSYQTSNSNDGGGWRPNPGSQNQGSGGWGPNTASRPYDSGGGFGGNRQQPGVGGLY